MSFLFATIFFSSSPVGVWYIHFHLIYISGTHNEKESKKMFKKIT